MNTLEDVWHLWDCVGENASRLVLAGVVVLVSACGAQGEREPGADPNANADSNANDALQNTLAAERQCIASRPWMNYGEGLHAPAKTTLPVAAATASVSSNPQCLGNQDFRFAAGRADITGPAAGKIILASENPQVYTRGIHTRQFARSFIIESPCNGKRVLLMQAETGMLFESVRNEVLQLIAADPELAPHYNGDNVMMNASHMHSGPGGQSHYRSYNALRFGHDPQTFETTVNGIFESIKRAHAYLVKSPEVGTIEINQGEIIGANKNRSLHAYGTNPESERQQYLDERGQEVNTPRLMTLLKMQSNAGLPVASMNWFGVHPTSDVFESIFEEPGNAGGGPRPISTDNKGYAGFLMERLIREENPKFVSSFQQAEEGDSFSRLYYDNPEEAERQRAYLPHNEPFSLTVANGQKQLEKALELYQHANEKIHGPIDFRFTHVQMDQVEVTDEYVLNSLQHPQKLDTNPKRTCAPTLGVSFPGGGGGSVAPGEVEEGKAVPTGVTCADPDYAQLVADSFKTASEGAIPTQLFAATVGCGLHDAPGLNLECHAEKPILIIMGEPLNSSASVVPFQLFRIGNLAIVGLPWEITTMSGRRIRQTVLDALKDDGVDYVVINGLSNDYSSYLATREEYSLQQYEGASTQFGPWSLAAIQQESRKLALDMAAGRATGPGAEPPVTDRGVITVLPPQGTDMAPLGSAFGDVVEDVADSYTPGDTARVVFQASSPNSDVKTGGSFIFVEQHIGGAWQTIYLDRDPETTFIWHSDSPAPQFSPTFNSTAEILWRIPQTVTGEFRIRFEGTANKGGLMTPYEGVSRSFVVDGATGQCS